MFKDCVVYVSCKDGFNDPLARSVESSLKELGVNSEVASAQTYFISGALSREELTKVCEELLCDTVAQEYAVNELPVPKNAWKVDVALKQGVMDEAGLSIERAVNLLGLSVDNVRTGKSYLITTGSSAEELVGCLKKFLVNDLINDLKISGHSGKTGLVNVLELSPEKLERLSKDLMLALNRDEMVRIQEYFKELGREPSDVELETLAQTWSEHCIHKTFKGVIEYDGEKIDGLLESYIMRATKEIGAGWCLNVFSDNAGIISFDDENALAVKVETHNHPTALDPYGGAGTGTGGVFRDAMGVGAKPILSTDCLFFGDLKSEKLPKGVMHPKRLMKGSVAGIRDYGNKMGVPTANGSIGFHNDYLGNPLIFAGVVGLLTKDRYVRQPGAGDLIVLAGGKTGRDGIHGVTFASLTLSSDSESTSSSAVQIGNPIEERRVLDALIRARDYGEKPLYSAVTDCGGGGLSSAVGEMGKRLGVIVELDKIPLKYAGLKPWEIWVSESQERMVLAVPEKNLDKLVEIFGNENCEATVIGRFTDNKKMVLKFEDEVVCDLSMEFLHKGVPRVFRTANKKRVEGGLADFPEKKDYTSDLKKILSHPSVASKEWVVRQYDHEVQANTVIKPLHGFDGHGDACVIKPVNDSWEGFVVSNGFNPNYSVNPRKMALSSIDEALRNNICCGGRRFALLDNFSWGNPENPDNLGALVEACKACYDYATWLGAPFISGKDSLYNDFETDKGERITIPHTLLITCVGLIPDVRKGVTSDFKKESNHVYLVGETRRELGGSKFYEINNIKGGVIPDVNLDRAKKVFEGMIGAIDDGLILSCHDCSEGGLAVSIAEMCFGGGVGAEVNLSWGKDFVNLFSESNSRFLVEVSDCEGFEKAMNGVPVKKIGVVKGGFLTIKGVSGNIVINESVDELKRVWRSTFKW